MKLRKRRMPHLVPPPATRRDLPGTLHLMFGARPFTGSRLQLFTEGREFYAAQLEAIARARRSIELESYIFHDDRVGRMYLDALTESARAGAEVRLLLDAAGNWHVAKRFFRPLLEAGGRVFFFRSFSQRHFLWWAIYRNHRDLLVVDGEVAFAGGAGIRDAWLFPEKSAQPWLDCVARVEGPAVEPLQAIFRRTWLEQTRELLLVQPGHPPAKGDVGGVVMECKPTAGSPTGAYMALQALFSMAQREVNIITPYFVPPPGLLKMMEELARSGTRLRLLLPGDNSDHLVTRAIARFRYGQLLRAGIEIYEYKPTMHHGKLFIADGRWTGIGSVNLDYRSLFRNEELLLLADDEKFARAADAHFHAALADSRRIGWDELRARPLSDRLAAPFAALIETHL